MRRPLAPCPQKQMRGERVARVCRRGDGRRAVQYLAIANRREIVHRFGRSAAILGGWAWCFACFGVLRAGAPRARACCGACDFGWCSCQEPLQTGWPAGGVPCRHRQTTVTGALSNCGRFAVARTERTAKRLACWLPRPPAEQPARHVRWPTCPSLRYEQRVGLQAGDKLLCCRPQKTAKPSKGACPRRKPQRPKRGG